MKRLAEERNIHIAKRLTAILVAVVFVFGMMYIPAEIYAVEPDAEQKVIEEGSATVPNEETSADTPQEEATESNAVTEEAVSEETVGEPEEIPAEEEAIPGEETEVTVARSIEDLAKKSNAADNEAFFTIDVGNEKTADQINVDAVAADVEDIIVDGGSTKAKKNDVVNTLKDSGYYIADAGNGREVEVTSTFATQRLCLVAEKEESIAAYGAETAVYYDDNYLLTYESEEATKQAFDALTEEYGSDSVIIDYPVKATASDTIYGWGTSYMGMTSEKANSSASGSVKVAIIDTGINSSHTIFDKNRIVSAYNVFTDDDSAIDDHGHGTAVAGVIAESTPSNVKIMPIKALNSYAAGSTEGVLIGAAYASQNGADIINLSLGNQVPQETLNYYAEKFSEYCSNSLIICASGNEHCNMDASNIYYFPGEIESTVCVGAYDRYGYICGFSNYGNAVDFAAPGSNICVANYKKNNAYTVMDGTSFSSPYVAAAAALKKAEGTTTTQLRRSLENIAVDMGEPGVDIEFGVGCPVFKEDLDNDRALINPGGSIESTGVAIANVSNMTYTGSEIMPTPIIIKNGFTLEKDTDFSLSYSNNVNVGRATMTITGAWPYEGSRVVQFSIIPRAIGSVAILSQTSYAYDGGVKTPTVTARNGSILEEGTDYSVTYSAGRTTPGNYTVSVTGLGNYSGRADLLFTINNPVDTVDLPAVKVSKPSAGKKKLTAKWKKVSKSNQKKIAGIEIEVFGNGIDKIYTAGKSSKSKAIKGLKSKKYYKVRVRAYRYDGYYKHVSKWSGFKKVKVK